MENLSARAIEIVDYLHTERLDYPSEYVPLIDALNKLAAYEDTGLEPEEVARLVQAEQDGRLVVLPCGETISSLRKAFDMAMRRLNAPTLPSPSYTTGEIHGYDSGFVAALGRVFPSWRTAAAEKERKKEALKNA